MTPRDGARLLHKGEEDLLGLAKKCEINISVVA